MGPEEQAAELAARKAKLMAAQAAGRLKRFKAVRAARATAKACVVGDAMRVVSRAVRHVLLEPERCKEHHYVGRRELVEAVRAFLSREWREGTEYAVSAAEAKLGAELASPQTPLNLQRLVQAVLLEEDYLSTHYRYIRDRKRIKNGDSKTTRVLDPEARSERVTVWMGIRLAGRAPQPNARSEAQKKSN